MATKIYESFRSWMGRDDREENGVSKEFALKHPDFEKDNESNKGCWNCSDCSRCSDCYGCYGCSRCSGCSGCSGCSDCYGCSRCSGCSDCYGCSRCSGCSDCSGLEWEKDIKDEKEEGGFKVPVIENIHSKVLEAVTQPENSLKMDQWHTCDTTHCRAGWVVHLAGRAGYKLEKQTSSQFAASQIYKASSPIKVSPVRFFEDNETAMEDIKRCAVEEQKLK